MIADPLDCKHLHTHLLSSMRSTMPRERWTVTLCHDCGQFRVTAENGSVWFDIKFELCRDDDWQAAGQYIRYLEQEERRDTNPDARQWDMTDDCPGA